MVQPRKFRGVRQRQWGSWVSEIRHPLLKKRVWLGKFDTAEAATRAYDEAAFLFKGRNARTNFPVTHIANTGTKEDYILPEIVPLSSREAGAGSDSNWVMRVALGNKTSAVEEQVLTHSCSSSSSLSDPSAAMTASRKIDEEERLAMQMIEELLNTNTD
ncbi:hypothetical protein AgCh_013341 [Apium graveolens]